MSVRERIQKKVREGSDSSLPDYSLREVISTLGQSLREYRTTSIWTPFLVTCETLIECVIPFVTALLLDQLASGAGMGAVWSYAAALIALALV